MLSEITGEDYKKQVIFLLNNNWTGRTDYYFPAQTAVNVERSHFIKLKNYKYMFCKKNTKETRRAILFMFINSRAENTSVIILSDFTMYNIDINCSHDYFYGSIFDISYAQGEIIICDSFMSSGNKINRASYEDRLSDSSYFISNIINTDVPINIVNYATDISGVSKLEDNEELFIMPNNLPITTGINYSCFKWKPTEKLGFNLKVSENENDIDLYTTNFKKSCIFATIKGDIDTGREQIDFIKGLEDYSNECIVEFNITTDKIIPMRVTKDNTIPTSIRSIEKIIHIKRENITLHDLADNCSK